MSNLLKNLFKNLPVFFACLIPNGVKIIFFGSYSSPVTMLLFCTVSPWRTKTIYFIFVPPPVCVFNRLVRRVK